MTRQEAFDKVWEWFVAKKKRPSRSADKTCMYLNPTNGARCAVGALLPKGLLTKLVAEGHNGDAVDDLLLGGDPASEEALDYLKGLYDRKPEEPEEGEDRDDWYDRSAFNFTFLLELQECHDSPADHCEKIKEFTEEVESNLVRFAGKWGLAVPA